MKIHSLGPAHFWDFVEIWLGFGWGLVGIWLGVGWGLVGSALGFVWNDKNRCENPTKIPVDTTTNPACTNAVPQKKPLSGRDGYLWIWPFRPTTISMVGWLGSKWKRLPCLWMGWWAWGWGGVRAAACAALQRQRQVVTHHVHLDSCTGKMCGKKLAFRGHCLEFCRVFFLGAAWACRGISTGFPCGKHVGLEESRKPLARR